MNMQSMKLPKMKKGKEGMGMSVPSPTSEEYPYGLRISLNEDQVKKLEHLMGYKIDDKVSIMAEGVISAVRSSEQKGGKKDRTVEIQITELGCEGADEGVSEGKGKNDGAATGDDAAWYKGRKK